MKDEHIIEAVGRCRVVIKEGQVTEVGEPMVKDCPLAKRFAYPVEGITPDAVGRNIESRISGFGMCSTDRALYSDDSFVGFGASEMLSSGIRSGLIDAAVIACDGAGTVVITDPRMVQGIGGRMSGLASTTPIPEVIKGIVSGGGIVPSGSAKIDPVLGLKVAKSSGFNRIAVTVADANTAEAVRRADPDALIIAVHMTGVLVPDAERLAETADIVTACASKVVREVCGKRAKVQAGATVPVFAMTERGKKLIVNRVGDIGGQILITHTSLPVKGEKEPSPLI